jgi:phage-related holin
MLHNFVLRLAVSCKVAWFAIVVIVVVLFLIAVALSITKLFL